MGYDPWCSIRSLIVKRLLLFLLAPAVLAAGVHLGHQLRVEGVEALRPAPIVTQAAADVHAALCR